MAQAATLTQQQLQRVLDYLRTRRHYKRNRTIILLTHYAMLRVGEVAALRYCDVLEADGQIKAETTLTAAQTKGKKGRKIWFAEKVRAELAAYVAAHKPKQLTQHEQAKQKAAAQQQKKSKRSKRISKRSISAPAPLPKIPKPMPKLAAPKKPIANPPQQPAQKHPTPTYAKPNPQPYPPKPLPTTSTTPTANASSPTSNVAAQINPTQQQRQQPLPPQNALLAQKKRVLPNKRA